MKSYLAFDLGASSGRAILGQFRAGKLEIEEVHRFENGPVDVNGSLHWNLLGLFAELKNGLRKLLDRGIIPKGMAVDTWGVDYALIDRTGAFVGFPYHYRDPRTADAYEYVFPKVAKARIYERTGIQFMNFNTLFQLAVMRRDASPALEIADKMLLMPNALTYLLAGTVTAEYSIATTTQLYDPLARDWAWDLIDALDLPRRLFPVIVPPATQVGELRRSIQAELNCGPLPVILSAGHDTASAVAAVPARPERNWAYLSSGTWSLLGVELNRPLLTPEALAANYTNEGGVGGKVRFLKNIMGLWLVQESRATWARQGKKWNWVELAEMARTAEPFRSLVDPNDESFIAPGDMPARLRAYCARTGQPEPDTPARVVRCAYESLALRYRQTIDELEELTGEPIELLHVVGGGSQNEVINPFTANAVNRPVVTGPAEATAIGNIICQAMATGDIGSLEQAREVVRNSFETRVYEPENTAAWEAAYQRYRALVG